MSQISGRKDPSPAPLPQSEPLLPHVLRVRKDGPVGDEDLAVLLLLAVRLPVGVRHPEGRGRRGVALVRISVEAVALGGVGHAAAVGVVDGDVVLAGSAVEASDIAGEGGWWGRVVNEGGVVVALRVVGHVAAVLTVVAESIERRHLGTGSGFPFSCSEISPGFAPSPSPPL